MPTQCRPMLFLRIFTNSRILNPRNKLCTYCTYYYTADIYMRVSTAHLHFAYIQRLNQSAITITRHVTVCDQWKKSATQTNQLRTLIFARDDVMLRITNRVCRWPWPSAKNLSTATWTWTGMTSGRCRWWLPHWGCCWNGCHCWRCRGYRSWLGACPEIWAGQNCRSLHTVTFQLCHQFNFFNT